MSNWNGKVRCFKENGFNFTKNKIYDVINGTIINDKGEKPYKDYKYKNIDDLNEDLCLMFEEIPKPKICEILGVDVDEKFRLLDDQENEFHKNDEYYINDKGRLLLNGYDLSEKLADIINGYNLIIKLPFYQFNEDEIIILKGLWLNGYKYIVRDKCGDGLWAYDGKPTQYSDFYDHSEETDYSVSLNDDFFKNVTFGNMLDISLTLSKIDLWIHMKLL